MRQNVSMPKTLVLTWVRVSDAEDEAVDAIRNRALDVLKTVDGLVSLTFWERADRIGSRLTIAEFDSLDAAGLAIERMSASEVLAELIQISESPPDLQRIFVSTSSGAGSSGVPIGGYASVSLRTADPGMGASLEQELGIIFQELSFIPGFVGSMIGHRELLEEEVVGIVFWENREAFEASLPKKVMYEVSLYRRTR